MTSADKSFGLLLELGDLTQRRTRAELLAHGLRTALRLMDADAVAVLTRNGRGERLVLHAGSAVPGATRLPPEGSEVARDLAESCEPLVLPNLSEENRFAVADGCPGVEAGPAMFAPLRRRQGPPGYIAVYRRAGRARYTLNDTRIILLLAAWLGTALESLRLATGTERVALMDELTQVYNDRFLKAALRRELRRASRFGHELSLVLIGVDQLPSPQDESTEPRGGALLKEVARVLVQQVRSFDLLGFSGTDEFMLILPETAREGAAEVAERMRVAVEQHGFVSATGNPVTASLGVACFPSDAAGIEDLVAASVRALRRARQRGRNCVATVDSRAA